MFSQCHFDKSRYAISTEGYSTLTEMCEAFAKTQDRPCIINTNHGEGVDIWIPSTKQGSKLQVTCLLSADKTCIRLSAAAKKFEHLTNGPVPDVAYFQLKLNANKAFFGEAQNGRVEFRMRASDRTRQMEVLTALSEGWCHNFSE
jgi:hypothetical protein